MGRRGRGRAGLIVDAHRRAVAKVLALLEREVAVTRAGANARNGASAHHDVMGVAATAYDHWDSRAGDPQLHTHVVVSNKVRTVFDRRWRSLDSRPMFASVVALSEHYNAVLADSLHRVLGVEWEMRVPGIKPEPGVRDRRRRRIRHRRVSDRARAIEIEKDRLIEEYKRDHGRAPAASTVIKLRATATLTTRPEKHIHSLAELTDNWRARAGQILGGDAATWARGLLARGARGDAVELARGFLKANNISPVAVTMCRGSGRSRQPEALDLEALEPLGRGSRQTMEWRLAAVADRETAVGLIVEEAKRSRSRSPRPELTCSRAPSGAATAPVSSDPSAGSCRVRTDPRRRGPATRPW